MIFWQKASRKSPFNLAPEFRMLDSRREEIRGCAEGFQKLKSPVFHVEAPLLGAFEKKSLRTRYYIGDDRLMFLVLVVQRQEKCPWSTHYDRREPAGLQPNGITALSPSVTAPLAEIVLDFREARYETAMCRKISFGQCLVGQSQQNLESILGVVCTRCSHRCVNERSEVSFAPDVSLRQATCVDQIFPGLQDPYKAIRCRVMPQFRSRNSAQGVKLDFLDTEFVIFDPVGLAYIRNIAHWECATPDPLGYGVRWVP